MASSDDLLRALQVQAELNRAAALEASEPEQVAAYRNASGTTADGIQYRIAGNVSVPEGTALAANYDPESGEVVWAETYTEEDGTTSDELGERVPCANGTDCLDSNFCYAWYECDPCEWCENNQCVPRDPARTCGADWECPCAPNESQHYDCRDTACRLTCETNADCGPDEVCGLADGYCGPACESDEQCVPGGPTSVGDAQPNTFCLNGECVFPCDPVRFCSSDADCYSGEYCGDREFRTASDPAGAIKECVPGCRTDNDCEDGGTCDPETRSCVFLCVTSADCADGEECNDDGTCSSAGELCVSDADCPYGWCKDGRCAGGCNTDAHCGPPGGDCPKLDSCVLDCPPAPGCTCEGDGCYDENWRDLCERDPACVQACPVDPYCARSLGMTCVDGTCERTCSDSAECFDDEVCSEGLCMIKLSNEYEGADDRLGCGCGDVCNQYGTCEPAVCTTDEECPSCSICEGGVCVEGCSDENPCPDGGCCNPDGRCAKSCTRDLDCASEPGNSVCLAGGCCGLACDPLVPCVSASDCQAGQYCGEEGYCLDGCRSDGDCSGLAEEDGGRYRCEKRYVRATNGALAPCEAYPGEECFSEIGQCVSYCLSAADCGEGESCEFDDEGNGSCQAPPPPACASDADCDGDGVICLNGTCSSGCRFDNQCPDGERCAAGNQCKLVCSDDQLCRTLQGEGSECVRGFCEYINDGDGGRPGCECFEFCDKDGYCRPYQCDSDLDCDEQACGSCLTGGVCGECSSDAECPGTKVCDIREGETTGTCAYACTPGGPGVCLGSSDCPEGFYCEAGECQRGCVEDGDCLPGEKCTAEGCVAACDGPGDCGTGYVCVQGACLYAGKPCSTDNNKARAARQAVDAIDARIDTLQGQRDDLKAREDALNERLANTSDLGESQALEQQLAEVQQQLTPVEQDLEAEQLSREALLLKLEEAENSDCPSGEVCAGDQCYPAPADCISDIECPYPSLCVGGTCQEPPSSDDYAAFEPEVIGCQSCAETCDGGVCRPARCSQDGDCGCGFCSPQGTCLEECRSDLDCSSTTGGRGRCIDGGCVACTSNFDCADVGPGAICDGGECKTPCGDGLSTGNCYAGLMDGDTCDACPDACPDDAPCRQTAEVCSTQEVYDIREGRMRVAVTYCQKCSRNCISSADCETGTVCGGFGICEISDGRCTADSDCYEDALAAGVGGMKCRNNTCIELGTTCFTNSDCDSGEVCDGGNCAAGVCGDNDPCQAGKVCIDNQCVWACGSDPAAIPPICKTTSDCPPGYSCGCDKGYGGYCLRLGMTCETLNSPGCPVGTTCCGGGCVSLSATGKQCCDDDGCPSGRKCCDGVCRGSCDERKEPDSNPADADLTEQNGCEAIGKCCGPDGWCVDCGCGPDNPCPAGQCCDEANGVCMPYADHPNTRFGAVESCKFDGTYCKLLTWDDQEVTPDELGGPLFKGCEVLDPVRGILRCWEGKEKSESQIERLTREACWKPKKKLCKCDEIPAADQCITDQDCGACGRCERRTFRNDACCGIYGEGEYEVGLDGTGPVGVDYVVRNICTREDDDEGCGCRSNADCTECETCEGGGPDSLGECVPSCEERCPCGGDLSGGGKCPTCSERYGPCATQGTVPQREVVDEETGETTAVLDRSACACGVDLTKACCQGLTSLTDMKESRTRCLRKNVVALDGTTLTLQTELCYDEEADECAQCEVDADCPGPSVCQGNQCVSECGKANSNPDNAGLASDRQDVGSIGGDPYSCYCCSEAGQCRPLYDNWIESDSKQTGPWRLTYSTPDGGYGEFFSEQSSYAGAVAEMRGVIGQDAEVVNSEGQNNRGQCRPCECRADGIECAEWADCDGCYRWEKITPDDAYLDKAEKLRLEDAMFQAAERVDAHQRVLDDAAERVTETYAQWQSARQTLANETADRASELETLYAQQEAENERRSELNGELFSARNAVTEAEQNLARVAMDGTDEEVLLAQEQLAAAEQEAADVQAAIDTLRDQQLDTQAQIDNIASQYPEAEALKAELDAAYERHLAAWRQWQAELDVERQLNVAQLKAVEAYNRAYYKPAAYRQVRTASCCIDDQARPDGECVYGACYICAEGLDGGPYQGNYEAALYGKVTGNRVSLDTDYTGYCKPKITGKTSWKYTYPGGLNCVKAPCSFWYKEERLGTGTNQRYYEYCTGSVIGCVLGYRGKKHKEACKNPDLAEYLQGYKYDIKLDDAGIFFTNNFVDWVKVGRYEGVDGKRTTSCLYANEWGYIRGNTLPTFEDLVASHPICAKANIEHGCPEDDPGCYAALRTYYERGSQDFEIKRLRREIAELEAYVQALQYVLGQLETLFAQKQAEKAELEQELQEAIEQLNYYAGLLNEQRAARTEAEAAVATQRDDRDAAQERYDEQVDAYQEASGLLGDKLQERADLEDELSGLRLELEVTAANIDSARAALNAAYLDVGRLQLQRLGIQQQLTQVVPGSIEEVELLQQLAVIDQQLEDAQAQYSELNSAVASLTERAEELEEVEIPAAEQAVQTANQEAQNLQSSLQAEAVRLNERQAELDAAVAALSEASENLLALNRAIPQTEQLLEFWTEKAGENKFEAGTCPDGYAKVSLVGGGVTCCADPEGGNPNCSQRVDPGTYVRDCSELCQKLQNIDEVLENIQESYTEVETAIESQEKAIQTKENRILEISGEEGDPTIVTGPMRLPIDDPDKQIRTAQELREELKGNVDVDQYLAEQDTWVAGATSQA